ncbi:hypothetical protein Pmani_032294 [Petrolisthes manimaculis]|uniref:Uncharacterized protein n=1 Tax=Petrolisthes manimaculis TaxID=1843537 RepID=A0AAE1TR62_9EUCA|nr:hypothetical protein Pmani_032294 [Petrolisthes manimaculis]
MGDSVMAESLQKFEDSKITKEKTMEIRKRRELDVNYWYMEVHLEYKKEELPCEMTAELAQVLMRGAVSEMFGESTSSLPLDILKFDNVLCVCVVRVPSSAYAKVRAALTVGGGPVTMAGGLVSVSYWVSKASGCLLSLAGPERLIS